MIFTIMFVRVFVIYSQLTHLLNCFAVLHHLLLPSSFRLSHIILLFAYLLLLTFIMGICLCFYAFCSLVFVLSC